MQTKIDSGRSRFLASTVLAFLALGVNATAQMADGVVVVDDMLVFRDRAHLDAVVEEIASIHSGRPREGYDRILDDFESEHGFLSLRTALEFDGWGRPSLGDELGGQDFARSISDPILCSLLNPSMEIFVGRSYFRVGLPETLEVVDPTPAQVAAVRAGFPTEGPNVHRHATGIQSSPATEHDPQAPAPLGMMGGPVGPAFQSSKLSSAPAEIGAFGSVSGPIPGPQPVKPPRKPPSSSVCTTSGCTTKRVDGKLYFSDRDWLVSGKVDVFNLPFYHCFTARTDAAGGFYGTKYIPFDKVSVQGSVKLIQGNCAGGGPFKLEFDVVTSGGKAVYTKYLGSSPFSTYKMIACCISSQHFVWKNGYPEAYFHQGKGKGATTPWFWMLSAIPAGTTPILYDSGASEHANNYFISVFKAAYVGAPYDGVSAYTASWFSGPVPNNLDLTSHVPGWFALTPGVYRVKLAVQNNCTNWNELTRWFTVF